MTTPTGQIACIAIIGPDNNPILIEKYCEESQNQEIDTLLFCSLDYFDQPQNAGPKKPLKNSSDRFLGNIQTSDRFQIWGYKSSLGYKIIILTVHIVSIPENSMRGVCERVKDVLFDSLMDPFYQPFSLIESPKVIAHIKDIALSLQVPIQL
ncbi:hypothetical protein TRFO_00999 [Tritrichomonas foetus]|uniref:Trafficking protein particle complex subunit 2-like protein n=1 Tax=Tritrichomonas foetus TaxID=1144522 RepID=A0A1J4L2R4_9EUKA|nr:hypothetical protein TRFO_00999 [Tritrichomonas foetus]|eukprot:OHT17690.1 hypothetical protein TRFO_00999 [Tritrichomonas foetus]